MSDRDQIRLTERARKFVEENYLFPSPQDRILILNAMMVGYLLAVDDQILHLKGQNTHELVHETLLSQ